GVLHLMTDSDPWAISNRGVQRINPFASVEDRKSGVYRSWAEYFHFRADAFTRWLEKTPKPSSALHDFERTFGGDHDLRRFMSLQDYEAAREYGKDWLVEGFTDAAKAYTHTGREVVAHLGGADEGGQASEILRTGRPKDRAAMFGSIYQTYGPL